MINSTIVWALLIRSFYKKSDPNYTIYPAYILTLFRFQIRVMDMEGSKAFYTPDIWNYKENTQIGFTFLVMTTFFVFFWKKLPTPFLWVFT
jgi:hypothetical protein